MTVEELKTRKKNLRLTTAQLAYMAGVPHGTLSKILTGETKNPSHETMEKIERLIMREEMEARLTAYRIAMGKYFEENPNGSQKEFEAIYRRENNLNDAPIHLATRIGEEPVAYGTSARADNRATIHDVVKSEEGRGKELIDGKIITSEMPGVAHQRMVKTLWRQIDRHIHANGGSCEAFDQGVNVYLDEDDYTLVIPDVVVICDRDKLKDKGIYGAPDWLIEVVSNSTRDVDYRKKLHKYMDSDVREYWIVDIDRQMVSVCINGEPMSVTIYHFDEEIPVDIYGGKLVIKMVE